MLLPEFEAWLDCQNLTEDGAEAANEIIRFLKQDECREHCSCELADAVQRLAAAIQSPHIQCTEPVDKPSIRQSDRLRNMADQGVSRPGRQLA